VWELDNDDILTSVDVPTLVIHGEQDAILRVDASRHNAAMVPDAELLVYEGVGHVPHLEAAERFNGGLAAFSRTIHDLR
jgi:non-heme chloroperoxidase